MKQKFHKTPINQRGRYKYYNAKGELVVTLCPGSCPDVTDIHIKLLHSLDDAEVYNNIKNWGSISFISGGGVEVSVKMPRSSQWVLSLDRMTDDGADDAKENRLLLEAAYRGRAEARRDAQREMLHEAVQYLPSDQQKIFRLFYTEEMTRSAIAKEMGMSVTAVCKRLKKMEKELREIIFKKIFPMV
ncbi:MAG: sigma-70 family RNA polymerase sigma factor [Selenomonadaceae bacterium]|nr:sigma-70 family RNA polymerase sigma factor [Selenomonadaceae bacterium]